MEDYARSFKNEIEEIYKKRERRIEETLAEHSRRNLENEINKIE